MPVLGEHPALDLVNTVFIRGGLRGRPVDALTTPADLADWIAEQGESLGPVELTPGPDLDALAAFIDLRSALHHVIASAVAGTSAAPEHVAAINTTAGAYHDIVELPPAGHGPLVRRTEAPSPSAAVLSRLARTAVDLLTGPDLKLLRACPAPGCVLFYLRTHPRRNWCSTGCGNRVRVARHSRGHDESGPGARDSAGLPS